MALLASILYSVTAILSDILHLTLKEDWVHLVGLCWALETSAVHFEHVCQCLRMCGVGEGTPEVVACPVAQLPF